MLLTFISALLIQTAPSLDGPGIVLILSGDTAFVTPTGSISREGAVRQADLVEIYSLGSESWEIVRRDSTLEFDCPAQRIRFLGGNDFDVEGRSRRNHKSSVEWSAIPDDYPPVTVLHALTCGDEDLSSVSHDSLENELPRLRERIG
ncbi:MAG: hypothetical protein DCF29_20670 [Alphaproteobacteria bacterium]|nr:MAG: hypothetical protein DCF29_20670 [Alphaproteobacteria bacterium]